MVQNVLVFATSNLSQLVHALSIVVENTSLPSANRRSNSDLSQCLRLKTKPFPAPHQTNKAKDTSLTYTPTSIKSTVVNVMFSAYTSLTEYIDGRKQVLLISPCQEKLNTLNFFLERFRTVCRRVCQCPEVRMRRHQPLPTSRVPGRPQRTEAWILAPVFHAHAEPPL